VVVQETEDRSGAGEAEGMIKLQHRSGSGWSDLGDHRLRRCAELHAARHFKLDPVATAKYRIVGRASERVIATARVYNKTRLIWTV
jgi:hypothetical protein